MKRPRASDSDNITEDTAVGSSSSLSQIAEGDLLRQVKRSNGSGVRVLPGLSAPAPGYPAGGPGELKRTEGEGADDDHTEGKDELECSNLSQDAEGDLLRQASARLISLGRNPINMGGNIFHKR